MKTILPLTLSALIALVLLPGCATESAKHSEGKHLEASGQMMDGCCVMKNGKMMTMKGGKLVHMKKNMTMPDGTLCMVNGVCVMKDGAKHKLAEGEAISPTGNLFHVRGLSTPGSHY